MIRKFRLKGLAISITLLALFATLWWNRWSLYDSYRLRNYNPPTKIVQLADDIKASDYGRKLFYVYHPELNDKQSFNENCRGGERTIVLGCYVDGAGIYLYNVTEPRLEGVVQVTSAHEMLHAAYGRLRASEKIRIGNLLEESYADLKDERIRASIEDYRKNGADITNELHSILGTEVRNLPPELEQYYKQYFFDRAKTVAYSEKYEQAFTQRQKQVADADNRLTSLKKEIESEQQKLIVLKQNLDNERQELDNLLQRQKYEAYNAGVPRFNQNVNNYNTKVRFIGSLIDKYNLLVAERNTIVLEEKELVKAIDSRPDTIESQ